MTSTMLWLTPICTALQHGKSVAASYEAVRSMQVWGLQRLPPHNVLHSTSIVSKQHFLLVSSCNLKLTTLLTGEIILDVLVKVPIHVVEFLLVSLYTK